MFRLAVEVEDFLAIRKAKLKSDNNITFIIAPNRAGKTQIMLFLYSFFWSLWRKNREDKPLSSFVSPKLKNTFLIRNLKDLISWGSDECRFSIAVNSSYRYTFRQKRTRRGSRAEDLGTESGTPRSVELSKSPIYISPAGLGDYYKGIWAIKKYYEKWRLVSEATTDLLHDLFILASESAETEKGNEDLVLQFERLFEAKFYIKNERIYIQERGRNYSIERTASGLKSLSWLYLILKYDLLGEILFIDEPEVNLHPVYIDKLANFIYKLSVNRKVFVSTHSDYLLESFNKLIKKNDLKVDVWIGKVDRNGAVYKGTVVNKDSLIDTTPRNEVDMKIVRELFS